MRWFVVGCAGTIVVGAFGSKPATPAVVGLDRCTGCHGQADAKALTGPTDADTWRSSLTHVLAVDPHAKAYAVLSNDLSKRITAHLRKHSPVAIPDAVNDGRCLACHVGPAKEFHSHKEFGISCEVCHGPASEWRTSHATWTAATRAAGIAATGFVDLNRADVRLKTCAGCHIGSPDGLPRDMNHDMIAAGHPALPQSLDGLLARYPKHWHDRERSPAVAVDRAAIEDLFRNALSADRQNRARNDARSPWPELAEQSCRSCHHSLKSADLGGASTPKKGD
jgi:hypothetical protein